MTKQERLYQIEAQETVFNELNKGCKRQLLCLATGLGKTYTATKIMEQFPRVLWLTHTEDLIEQSAISILGNILDVEHLEHIENHNGIIGFMKKHKNSSKSYLGLFSTQKEIEILDQIGLIKEDLCQWEKPIVVASIQTLHRRLDKIPADAFDLIVVDEAHLAAASTWSRSIEHFADYFSLLLGLTATPERADGVSLSNLFDKIVFERDIKFGIDNKFLCELEGHRIKTNTDLSKVKTTGGEFNTGDLSRTVNNPERNLSIVNKWLQYAKDRPTIVSCVDVQHCLDMVEVFKRFDVAVDFVVGNETICPNRHERLRKWKAGETLVMCQVNILVAGFDYPDLACVLMARPTKSKTVYLQLVGRGTRIKTEKSLFKNCIILDIVDNTGKHSLVNSWELDRVKDLEDRVFISESQKQQIREARERKLQSEIEKDQKVDLMALPKVHVYDTAINRQPATEKQLEFLRERGHDVDSQSWTKGQCSEVISNEMCSREQLLELHRMGYDVSKGATLGQYKKAKQNNADTQKFKQLFNNNKLNLPFKFD